MEPSKNIYFYVGPINAEITESEIFTIPRSLIPPDTFLSSYIRPEWQSPSRIIDDKKVYILTDINPDAFTEFAVFLHGGDFHWNEEIAAFFEYMGYPNVEGYPLDFWKIKLQDNWMRDNFYRLGLSDIRVIEPPLALERGPYVGLIDITDELSHEGIVLGNRFQPQDLNPLKETIPFDLPVILAGGALLSLLIGSPHTPKDFDLFVVTKDETEGEAIIRHVIANYKKFFLDTTYEPTNLLDYSHDNPGFKITRTENAITIGQKKAKFQIILRLYSCPSEVVHGFDLDVSGILWDGERVLATRRGYYAIKKKINFFDPERSSPSYAYRLAKYATRGYRVWLPHFNPKKVNYWKLSTIAEGADDIMISAKERELENIIRRGIKEGHPPYTPYISPYWKTTPTYKSSDPEVYDAFRQSEGVREIFTKGSLVDLIIFASYFLYLPGKSISDYDTSEAGAGSPAPSKISPWKLYYIGRDGREIHGDEEDYVGRGELAHVEVRGRGWIIFNVNEVSINFIERIIKLPPNTAKEVRLSEKLSWKKQDPMTQLTSTFHPQKTRIENWYAGSLLYRSED